MQLRKVNHNVIKEVGNTIQFVIKEVGNVPADLYPETRITILED